MVIRTSLRPLGKVASNLVHLEWFNGLTLTYPDEPQMTSEYNADHAGRSIYNPYMQMWEDTLRGRFLSTGQNTYNCRHTYYISGELNEVLPDGLVQFRNMIRFKGSGFTANSSNDEEAIDSAEMISNFNYLDGQLTFTSSESPVTIKDDTPKMFGPVYEPAQKHWYASTYYADSGLNQINLRTARDSSSNPEQWVLMKRAYISGISGFSGSSQIYGPFRNNASMLGVIANRLKGAPGLESKLSENNGLKSGGPYSTEGNWVSQAAAIKLYLHRGSASKFGEATPWSCSYHYVNSLYGAFCVMVDMFSYNQMANFYSDSFSYAKVSWSSQTTTQNIDGIMSTNQTFWDATNEQEISIYSPWAMNGSTPYDRFLAVLRTNTTDAPHTLLSLNYNFQPQGGKTIPNNRLSFTNTGIAIADNYNKVMSLHSMANYLLVQRADYSIRLIQFVDAGLPSHNVYKEFKPIFDGSSKWAVIGFFRNYVYFVQINNPNERISRNMDENKIVLNSKICRVSMYNLMKKD
jgi:hypothetical protein|nr:MAG TPA: hypothetical protein [Caudoviricetes sp.]